VLTLTSDAAEAVRTLVSAVPQLPDDSGLRIRQTEGPEAGFELTMVESPEEGDAVIEEEGARVFVDAELAPDLDDKTLDASVVEDRIQFTLTDQA
jgi:iron-sulfur cluster assembly protein